ncbi:MAG: molecular chaperone [Burkholderiales bacterium]
MNEADIATGTARADFCRFLAACYYEPGPEFREEGLFESMAAAGARIDPGLEAGARRLGEAFAAEDPEDLLVDYTRLFLGPVDAQAKPYGSVWLGGETTLMQDSTMAVLALYEEGGFEIAEDFRELPDHVAAELEFLYLLLFRSIRPADAKEREALAALRSRFLGEHLGRWAGPFTEAVAQGAQCAFYRELAALTDRFVKREAAQPAGH